MAVNHHAFPFKLHALLDNTVDKEAEIVSWLPSGKAFRIHKPKEFKEKIMPKYFRQTKYRSLQKQLHIYGFCLVKDKCSFENGAYFHELFVRDNKDLCKKMTRERAKPLARSPSVSRPSYLDILYDGYNHDMLLDHHFHSETIPHRTYAQRQGFPPICRTEGESGIDMYLNRALRIIEGRRGQESVMQRNPPPNITSTTPIHDMELEDERKQPAVNYPRDVEESSFAGRRFYMTDTD